MANLTIANGASVSDDFRLEPGDSPIGVNIPTGLDGTGLYLQVTLDGGTTYTRAQNVGGGSDYFLTKPTGTGGYTPIDPRVVKGVRRGRFEAASAQTSARTLQLATDRLA